MTGILEGLKVVDMGLQIAIPAAGAMLADWGAEVIKVEPLSGEQLRGLRRIQRVDIGIVNPMFHLHNRNKKGLAVDLKTELGRDILYKLIKISDVFMSNYEVSTLKKLKADYASLSQVNSRLIYCVLTGYGTVGPDKDDKGFDHSAGWARSGAQYMTGEPGTPAPMQPGSMIDRVSGIQAVAGILAALLHKEKTGKGQELELSLYHTAVWAIARYIQTALFGLPLPTHDRTKAGNPLWNPYRAKDDRWFQLAMQTDVYWPGFCRAIERPDLENDPRFNNLETRGQNGEELIRILDKVFASKNRVDWEKRFKENDCIYGRVETPLEVITDPQALANDFFSEVDHSAIGKMKLVNTPVKFRQNPASVKTPAPEVGQHTEEILLDLGYNWDDISQLKEQKIIL
ncbi:CaiB/BaiF CoA transferase family protein [Chloroflexota bacterium]